MEKTIELVNLWGDFIRQHPDGNLEDFCRHLLIHKRESSKQSTMVGGVVPLQSASLLMKIIGRIHKLHVIYISKAFEDSPLNQVEEYGLLITIHSRKNPIKSEVISSNLLEPSSGTDMLNRLKKKGLLKEYPDHEDGRSKRVELTKSGERILIQCRDRMERLAQMMLHDLAEDDMLLCIQLLKGIEIKFSERWMQDKKTAFENLYQGIVR